MQSRVDAAVFYCDMRSGLLIQVLEVFKYKNIDLIETSAGINEWTLNMDSLCEPFDADTANFTMFCS